MHSQKPGKYENRARNGRRNNLARQRCHKRQNINIFGVHSVSSKRAAMGHIISHLSDNR